MFKYEVGNNALHAAAHVVVRIIARAAIAGRNVYTVSDSPGRAPYIVAEDQLSPQLPAPPPPPAPPWNLPVNALQQRVADLETRNRVVTAQLQAMHDRLAVMDKAIAGQARKLKAHDKEFMGIKIKEDATLKPDEVRVEFNIDLGSDSHKTMHDLLFGSSEIGRVFGLPFGPVKFKESPVDKAAREFKEASEELEKAHFAVRDAEKNLDRAREYKQAKTEAKRKAYATLMVATGAPPEPSPY